MNYYGITHSFCLFGTDYGSRGKLLEKSSAVASFIYIHIFLRKTVTKIYTCLLSSLISEQEDQLTVLNIDRKPNQGSKDTIINGVTR